MVYHTKDGGACLRRSFRDSSQISSIKFLGVVLAFLRSKFTFENYCPRMGVGDERWGWGRDGDRELR